MESFPTAFAIPIGLVKLVQGLWLLDHNDQQVRADFGSKVLASGTILDSWKCNNSHLFLNEIVGVSVVLIRVHSSCSYIQLPLSVSLSGSMNESCRR